VRRRAPPPLKKLKYSFKNKLFEAINQPH